MSLFGAMQTSVSGMTAQSNALSAIGDNIANSSTVGYKEANAQFSTLLGQSTPGNYASGGVLTDIRYGITQQGTITSTTSSTDMAVNGNGFFLVSKGGQGQYLTRAGSFTPDQNGNLVNAAGYGLMGYPVTNGTPGSTLQQVNISANTFVVSSSTVATLAANLPSAATVVTGTLPSANTAASTYSNKSSLTVYDNLGTADVLDVYFTRTGPVPPATASTWEVSVFQQSAASASGGFPYSSGPIGTQTLTFNTTTGALAASSPKTMTINVPNGNAIAVDVSGMQSLSTAFGVSTATADGEAPTKLSSVSIGSDGTVTGIYGSGLKKALYQIPLATVASPNNLTPVSGNVYTTSNSSGNIIISTANTNGLGAISSGSLEQSTVDLATELTNMIVAQRSYEANSKVLQSASDLLGVLNRISVG